MFVITLTAKSQVIFADNFEYGATAGSIITLSGGKWVENTNVSATNIIQYDPSSSLTFSSLVTKGGKLNILNNGQDITAAMASSVTSGDVYAGMLINFSAAQTTGDYFFHFMPTVTTNSFYGRVFVKLNGTNINFGLMKNSGGSVPYSSTGYSLNTTYCIVLKYSFNAGTTTDDVATLYVFDAATGLPDLEPGTSEISQTINTDATGIGAIAVRQGAASAAPTASIDNIVVSTTWSSMKSLMPLQLKSFNCIPNKNGLELKWQSTNEINFDYYSLEKSTNGKDFNKLATIKGIGRNGNTTDYSFFDTEIGTAQYYRLKMVDKDGTYKYSQVIYNKSFGGNIHLNVYPNPATDYVVVSHPKVSIAETIKLCDMNGKTIKVIQPVLNTLQTTVNTSDLIKGSYVIVFSNQEQNYTAGFIK
jgi:hypothetical protein